jgi:ubiquinol-cytochrome c reductase cytochrome c subunit
MPRQKAIPLRQDCHSNSAAARPAHIAVNLLFIQERVQIHARRVAGVTPTLVGWLASALLLALALPAAFCQQNPGAPPPDGKAIFHERCAKCHGEQGEGISSVVTIAGPDIQAEHNMGQVMAAVEVGPEHMPAFSWVLTVPEIRAVSEYVTQKLAVIPLSGGDLSEGGKLFRIDCAVCHRTAVRGGALAFTGINAPNLTSEPAPLIAGAIRWGPGPMPKFPPSLIDDKQLDSIVEYVRYVQHPPSPGGSPMEYIGPVAEGCVTWIVVFGLIAVTTWIEKGGKG